MAEPGFFVLFPTLQFITYAWLSAMPFMTYYGHLCLQSAKEAALQRALAAEGLVEQLQEDNEQQVQEHRRAFQKMADTCRESEALHQHALLALQVSEV